MQAFLCACLMLCVLGCATTRETTSPHTLSDAEIVSVQTGIQSFRKDLDAPRFRGFRAARSADGQIYVCGWMNSRNSHGGYSEEQPFIGTLFGGQFVPDRLGKDQAQASTIFSECQRRGVGI